MNSFQRYANTVKGKPTDFLPRVPILMQFAAEYIDSNYGAFASDFNVLVKANEVCAADFGMDQLSAISDPYRETQGFGAQIEFVTDGVPRCLCPPLEKDKDISALQKPDPLESVRMKDRVNAISAFSASHKGEYSIMGWIEGPAAEAADLRGVANFLMDLMDDPSYASDLMDVCIKTGIDFARAQIEAGADTIGLGDAIASQVSPDMYKKQILPKEMELIREIKNMGGLVRLHICGNITHILEGISQLDIDIIDVDHMVDMETVRRVLPDRTVIAGNIDPAAGVFYGTPQSIRVYMTDAYKRVGNPFMVNAGCEIPAGTSFANLKALCEPIPYKD